ncbi:TPA: hypothetical protein U1250_000765 [Streptococcus suis]|nr:hypothetical protein [Streptococcus suis]HEM5112543.1 hypothetical protein [Streptococcus suis]HEM5187090.1 hypothetical protein [Streptococcus suis]HEM5670864.1 hypothetical protein [Streptococcus suis]
MERDILPDLLKEVQDKFETSYGKSEVVRRTFEELKKKRATYATANDFALEVGDILAEALSSSVTGDRLPDGKMYYNIAKRLLTDTLGHNFELVSGYTGQVQEDLNRSAKIGLQVQVPEVNQDRIDGLVNRLSSEDEFSKVAWMLQEPIINFTQSIVDDSVKANAEFHYDSGLSPQIIRKEGGKCCDWCREVVGIYQYPKVPKDVYRRHQRCRCTVDYDPKNGKVQNVHSKRWSNKQSESLKDRQKLNVESVDEQQQKRYNRIMKSSGAVYGAWNDKNDEYGIEREKHAKMYYEQVRNRNREMEVVRVAKNSSFSVSDVEKIFDHIFINEHDLEEGRKRFDPNYDMAESWRRLTEVGGKNIQKHDIIMLHHELMELGLMAKGMSYDEAHNQTNKVYNYQMAWIEWAIKKGDL